MSRTRSFAVLAAVLAVLATSACRPKKPVTTPEPVAPAPVVTPAPTPAPVEKPVEDPLAGDLDSVNAYIQRMGLLGDVYFDFDQATLTDKSRSRLEQNAKFLIEHPQFRITIEGHCDERGTNDYNLALSERRASAARGFIVPRGVPAAKIKTVPYGEERPVCSSSDEACWQQNRRAHFVVTGRD